MNIIRDLNHTTEVKNLSRDQVLYIDYDKFQKLAFTRFVPSITESIITNEDDRGITYQVDHSSQVRFTAPCRMFDYGITLEVLNRQCIKRGISVLVVDTSTNKRYTLAFLLDTLFSIEAA